MKRQRVIEDIRLLSGLEVQEFEAAAAEMAIRAALTGHQVFSTLHTKR